MGSVAKWPIRIFGPDKSAMMATGWSRALATVRMFSMFDRWWSKSPYEKFRRATFIPARIIRSRTAGELDAGPIVATILVLLGGIRMVSRAQAGPLAKGSLKTGSRGSTQSAWRAG